MLPLQCKRGIASLEEGRGRISISTSTLSLTTSFLSFLLVHQEHNTPLASIFSIASGSSPLISILYHTPLQQSITMKFSATLVAAFAATVLAAPVDQTQEAAQAGDQVAFYEQYGGDSTRTKICSIEKGQKKCIEIDTSSGQEEYKCEGADPGSYKSKCEQEYEKKLIEEYKKKKEFKDFERKKEFEEWEKKKGLNRVPSH